MCWKTFSPRECEFNGEKFQIFSIRNTTITVANMITCPFHKMLHISMNIASNVKSSTNICKFGTWARQKYPTLLDSTNISTHQSNFKMSNRLQKILSRILEFIINCFLHNENFMRDKYKGNQLKDEILTLKKMVYFWRFDGILSSYEANQDCYWIENFYSGPSL